MSTSSPGRRTATGDLPDAESFEGTDRFLVQRRIGSGAFGVVYEAVDRVDHSRVAVKVLRSAEADALYRFKKGFRSLADLRHPNLVSFYELITQDGVWFFSMELIDGTEFLEALCGRPGCATDDYPRVGHLTRQLAAGLDAVHRSGKVHRDIKPPNVLVTRDDRVKLLDFGLVTELQRRRELRSDTQHMVGTPAYMAPEQAHGDLGNPASDWYSVGIMLFQALTGELPFQGGLMQILTQKLKGPADDALRRLKPDVPEDLERLVIGLLHPEPAQRWTGERVLEALRNGGTAGSVTPSSGASGWAKSGSGSGSAASGPVEPAPVESGSAPADDRALRDPTLTPNSADTWVGTPFGSSPGLGSSPSPDDTWLYRMGDAEAHFVGREDLLGALDDAVEASAERTVFVRLRGASGMGKSALLDRFLTGLDRRLDDAVILSGRCYVQESVPYKALDAVVDALSRYLMSLPRQDVEVLLPTQTAALARIFPVLLRVKAVAAAPSVRDAEPPTPQVLRRRAFAALRELMSRLAVRHRLAVVVDDLQWGDLDSFLVLDELFASADPPPFLFVGVYRQEDAAGSAFVSALEERIATDEWPQVDVRTVDVVELSVDEARELLRHLRGVDLAQERIESVLGEAAGSPLFLSELARHVQEIDDEAQLDARRRKPAGSSTAEVHLRDVLRLRIQSLGDSARRLLEVIAVAGQPVPTAVARQAADLASESQSALAELRTGRFARLHRTGRGDGGEGEEQLVETYHDRIRETVLEGLDEECLRVRHRRLAEALESTGRADPETLAVHFQATEEAERACRYAVDAAHRAENALAFDRAARLYRLALDLLPEGSAERYDLEVQLGKALAGAGRSRDAAETFLAAVHHSGTVDPLDVQRHAAEKLLISGHIDRGMAVLRHVLRTVGMELETRRWRALAKLWLLRLRLRFRGLGFKETVEEEVDPDLLRRIDVCWSVEVGLCLVDVLHASEFHARHLLLALEAGEPRRIARALAMEVFFGAMEGADADAALARARAMAGSVDGYYASSLTEMASGMISCSRGRWAEASRRLQRAERHLREARRGVTWELDTVRQFRSLALLHMGRWGELFAELPELLEQARDQDDLYLEIHLHHWVEHLRALADDRVEEAEASLASSLDGWTHEGFHYQHFGRLVAEARLRLYRGLGTEAWQLVSEAWPQLRGSMIQRIEMVMVQSHDLRARCAIAAWRQINDQTGRSAFGFSDPQLIELMRVAESDARRLERAGSTWTLGLSRTLLAGMASLVDDHQGVVEHLAVARNAFESADMLVHAAVVRRRLGEVLGDAAEIRAVDRLLAATCSVENPARLADVMAPGAWT